MNLLFVIFFKLSLFLVHDFHTSITEVEYNAKEKAFEVSIRVFSDDLETTILKNDKIALSKLSADKKSQIIEQYILKHFAFFNKNKQKKNINFIGSEIEGDATWVYVEIPFAESLAGCVFQNDIFFETFADQTNLINLKNGSFKKSMLFKGKQRIHEVD